jgi:5'-nucleotidase
LARRATAIKQMREVFKGLVLVLDAGSSLMGQWVSLKTEGESTAVAMDLMGYDALTVGRMDLYAGIEKLQALAEKVDFAILSNNLVSQADGKLYFQPYTTVERNGKTVAIIGVSDQEVLSAPGVQKAASLLEPIAATQEYVEQLRPQVDLVVVLSHLGLELDRQMAEQVEGIDLIVGGYDRKLMQQADRVGNTLIIQQGYRGEWLGGLRVGYDASGQILAFQAEIITLDDNFADDPEMVAAMRPYIEQYPTPTPAPTWTPDPRTPTANMTQTVQAYYTRAVELARTQTAVALTPTPKP